jgi:multiple sugar transport system permease protein
MGLTNYKAVLGIARINEIFGGQPMAVARGFFNSAVVSTLVAAIATAMATVGGYAFGRFRFPYKNTLLFVLLSVRVLPPIAVLIPYFVILSALHLIGSYFSLTVTYLTAVMPLLTWLLTGYFASLPIEIERAARIDGCGRMQALWHVTIPMAMPGIAAAFVIAFLTAWNELLFGVVLTGGTAKQTLSPALLAFSPTMPSGGANLGMTLFAAGSVLSAIPPLVLALLVQRYITRLNVADPLTVQGD